VVGILSIPSPVTVRILSVLSLALLGIMIPTFNRMIAIKTALKKLFRFMEKLARKILVSRVALLSQYNGLESPQWGDRGMES
jgi:hypothetical protein